MALRPRAEKPPLLVGRFSFAASHSVAGEVTDTFDLEIEVPVAFPAVLPVVKETGGRIPKHADEHVNRTNETLCLGSPLRLRSIFSKDPTLTGFADRILVPYLYAQSRRRAGDKMFAFGELAHGLEGKLDDYVSLFGLKHHFQAIETLRLLGLKKRIANKHDCPCECRKRLGRCRFNVRVRETRRVANLDWFRREHREIPEAIMAAAKRQAKEGRRSAAGMRSKQERKEFVSG